MNKLILIFVIRYDTKLNNKTHLYRLNVHINADGVTALTKAS